jgi:hypothetical protein
VWVDPVRGGLEEEGNPGYWEFQAAYITLQNGKRVDISASLDMDAEEDIDHELQKQ